MKAKPLRWVTNPPRKISKDTRSTHNGYLDNLRAFSLEPSTDPLFYNLHSHLINMPVLRHLNVEGGKKRAQEVLDEVLKKLTPLV